MKKAAKAASGGNILIVDDTPTNLHLLAGMLKEQGYRVRPVTNGPHALRSAKANPPDLILLDVNMPEMDGYEVCRRLKQDEQLREIPVLFISALNESEDRMRAFKAGGFDYVEKPFQLEEIGIRVQLHLELRRQKQELQANYQRLQELEHSRDNLTSMIVHDMRSPLLALQLTLEYLQTLGLKLDSDTSSLIDNARQNTADLVEMVSQLLDISHMESGLFELQRKEANLASIARDVAKKMRALQAGKTFHYEGPETANAWFDPQIIRRVIGNLLGNAFKFTSPKGKVQLVLEESDDQLLLSVRDDGPGIPLEHQECIFKKFKQMTIAKKRLGSGLGLTFAKMAVEAHGGKIGVESQPGCGSRFWIELPKSAKPILPTDKESQLKISPGSPL